LNFDFPGPTREWDGVFDVWLQGDAQNFADLLQEEIAKEAVEKEAALERKRKREEEVTHLEDSEEAGLPKKKKAKTENQNPEKPTSKWTPKVLETPSVRPRKPKSKYREDMDIGAPSVPKIMLGGSKLTIRIPPLKGRYIPEVCITTPAPRGLKAVQCPRTPPATHIKHRVTSLLSHSDYPPSDTTEIGYDESDLSELSADEVADELPRTAIRTAQYGHRATGG
jgi:NAD-dependent histone deacetylase SIR2